MDSKTHSAEPGSPEAPRFAIGKVLLGIAVGGGIVLGCWFGVRGPRARQAQERGTLRPDLMEPPEEVLEWRSKPETVRSQACRRCHPDQYASYLETNHSRTLAPLIPEN